MDVVAQTAPSFFQDGVSPMARFIANAGGIVRFDVFSREHLVGDGKGFYSDAINLAECHSPVLTPFSCEPEYLSQYARLVLESAQSVAASQQKNTIQLCEIGIGGGELFGEICKLKSQFSELSDLEIIYHGVDPNKSHVQNLISRGAHAHVGIAQRLPLEDRSIDLIVGEEVLDSLPYRVFLWDRESRHLTKELFVALDGDRLKMEVNPIKLESELTYLENYLSRINYTGDYYFFSPDYELFWKEINRVLTDGGRALVSDYSTLSPIFTHCAMDGDEALRHEKAAIHEPYTRDLTHFVDLRLQGYLAKRSGFSDVRIALMSEIDVNGSPMDLVSGRFIVLASRENLVENSSRSAGDSIAAELQALSNKTPGCRVVVGQLMEHPRAKEVIEIFKKHGLRDGAFWCIYSDRADRDIERFVRLVLSEDKAAIEIAKRFR